MLDSIRRYIQLWKLSKNYKHDLDAILAQANPNAPLHQKLVWLVDLIHWVRHVSYYHEYQEVQNVKLPASRLKFLFMVLERNPKWKSQTAKTIRSILREVRAVDLFSETGLSEEYSFWSELKNRLLLKALPEAPLSEGLSNLFSSLFPDSGDVVWVSSLDPQVMNKIIDLINFEREESESWERQMESDIQEALYVLSAQIRSLGLSPKMRKRMGVQDLKKLPFFYFTEELDKLIQKYESKNTDEFEVQLKKFRKLIWKCIDSFNDVYRHLDQNGVNTNIVFILESAQSKLKRIDDLITLLVIDKVDSEMLIYFLSQLIEENQERKGIFSLVRQNIHLISRKIVDRSAETGEYYITKNKDEFVKLFKKASGGGALTAFTVVLKMMSSAIGAPLFIEGFLFSLNYAASFVLIQLSGFTLATKQPAMTGPAIAAKLQHVDNGESIEYVVDEVVKLIRSQSVGILGNVLLVAPVALIINYLYFFISGHHIVNSAEKANYIFSSTDIFGPTIIYAAFTGVLLWLSSIVAGYVDNWFYFHKMKKVISYNRRLNFVFGNERCESFGAYLEKNISGFAANISLGFLLGMTPQIMSFLGIFLDVRHVTLSSGTLALGTVYYGSSSFFMWEFWRAIVGVGFIGALNVGVSFSLALFVAVRSRNIKSIQRRLIYTAILRRLKSDPISFIYPREIKN